MLLTYLSVGVFLLHWAMTFFHPLLEHVTNSICALCCLSVISHGPTDGTEGTTGVSTPTPRLFLLFLFFCKSPILFYFRWVILSPFLPQYSERRSAFWRSQKIIWNTGAGIVPLQGYPQPKFLPPALATNDISLFWEELLAATRSSEDLPS